MDTHIAPSPDLDAPLSARLPGEPDPDTTVGPDGAAPREPLASTSVSAKPRKRRRALLAGVAVAALVVAGGAFLLSPLNTVIPVPPQVASTVRGIEKRAGLDPDRPLAPSAALAHVDLPERPATVVVPRYTPQPRNQALNEILAMRDGSAPGGATPASGTALASSTPSPAAKPQPAPRVPEAAAFVPHEPGTVVASPQPPAPAAVAVPSAPAPSLPARPAGDITQAVVAATAGHPDQAAPPPAPAAEPAPDAAVQPALAPSATAAPATVVADMASLVPDQRRPAPAPAIATPAAAATAAPADPVTQALNLKAGPMTTDEQIKVIEMVTQMATMVRDVKVQNAALRADFAKARADDRARLADFARRLDLAEARNALAAASAAGDTLEQPTVPPAPTAAAARPVAVTRTDAVVPSSPPASASQDLKHYRVQAASPGLALLTEVARGGGDGAQIQVTVGDSIPGWGKVKAVAQRGTSWVVSTERGNID